MGLFSTSDACRLLADPEGPAARRYHRYQDFLDHNHRALRLLSELEMLDRGEGLSTLFAIQRRTGQLLQEVRGLLVSLNDLAVRPYPELLPAFESVAQDLAPLIERKRDPIDGPLTLPFSELTQEHTATAGAKAVNLARVKNELGMPAPDGFVVTTAAFDLFLRENRLLESVDAMLAEFDPEAEQTGQTCVRLQEEIRNAPLPPLLADAVDEACRSLADREPGSKLLAVRSSAVGEDTEASFAGQYTTVLSVERSEIAAAYQTVLASKFALRSILYRLRFGLSDADTPMAVAVMPMVPARSSGVLYTVDPSRPASGQARIDAARGSGGQVVVDRHHRMSFGSIETPWKSCSRTFSPRRAAPIRTIGSLP